MIVPMKKIAVITQAKDAVSAVRALRLMGVVHVEHQASPKGRDVAAVSEQIARIDEALGVLLRFAANCRPQKRTEGPLATAAHIIDSYKRLGQLEEYARQLNNKIAEWQAWGDFNPDMIKSLAEKNIFVGFYQIPLKELKNLPESVIVKRISYKAGMANCVIISRQKTDIGYKELAPPKTGLCKMKERLTEDAQVIKAIQDEIKRHCCYSECLKKTKEMLEREFEFRSALAGMGSIGEISYLAGYIPYDAEGELRKSAYENKWALHITEPSQEDSVPTLVRNVRWVEVIRPVFKLLEVVPGYKELDISPIFLIFLSLFFGMIIGDAGYGALYFLLTFLAHKRFGKKTKDNRIFFLFYMFSGCTILWGLLTGTVFGQQWYLEAGFKPLMPVLNDTKFLQAFCFFLGAFHLSLAHLWQAGRKTPSITALSDVGWICILWAAFFLAKTLILNDPFPYFGKGLIITGLGLVILCTSPQRNIFKMVGNGLATVALSLVNNFTDVVSYIRLFAVGLAGIAISDTINSLAAGFGPGIVSVLIISLGHTINIVLGPLSVLVHGIRLNVLEFSGHAGLSWSGVAYKPLKED
jgi:V/A-type H+-transporting ATPase subunit I